MLFLKKMLLLTHNQNLCLLHAFNYSFAATFIFASFKAQDIFIILFFTYIFMIFGVSIGLHRYFSHRSFKTTPLIEKILAFIATLSGIGSILTWVAVHRKHHKFADTIKDPHSPLIKGPFKVWFGNFTGIYETKVESYFYKDLIKNQNVKFFHKNYFSIIASYVLILYIIDPSYVALCYSIPQLLVLHSTSAINVLCHMFGKNSNSLTNNSKNNPLLNLFIIGEGYHNNHHNKPYHFRFGKYDFPGLLIDKLLRSNK